MLMGTLRLLPGTDADAANLLTSDIDLRQIHYRRKKTAEGFCVNCEIEQGIDRGLSYAVC
jgi:isocitrate lyase